MGDTRRLKVRHESTKQVFDYHGARLIVDRLDDGSGSPCGLTRRLCALPSALVVAAMAGFAGSVGMGGGSVIAPFLRHRGLALCPFVPTAVALNSCISFGSSNAFVIAAWSRSGNGAAVQAHAALLMGAAAVAAASLNVALAHRLPMAVFRTLIGAVNVVSALTLIVQLLRHSSCHGSRAVCVALLTRLLTDPPRDAP